MKLLIVDDHAVLREGLAALLQQIGPDTTVVQAQDANEAITLLGGHPDLDVVVLDLVMPGMNGLDALSEFGRTRPDLPVIVLSSSEDPLDVRKALAAGALGYVPKSAGQRVLLSAIQLVMNGELYVPPLVLEGNRGSAQSIGYRTGNRSGQALTARQVEILKFLSEGAPNKLIAKVLGLSEKTVKAHITAIFKTLNVENRTQAAVAGRNAGLI
jgi:two-component system, NarL family, nitrate/nitrite response regulator NarL